MNLESVQHWYTMKEEASLFVLPASQSEGKTQRGGDAAAATAAGLEDVFGLTSSPGR